MMKVNDTSQQQPDVSKVTPVHVNGDMTRSFPVDVVYINEYGKYQRMVGYWDDVDKLWRYESNGEVLDKEVVRTEPNEDTKEYEIY